MEKLKPNIIFIVMDALRAKNLSCYGYSRNTSPNIDLLAKQGILFEEAFSTNNTTNPSFLSIHSGRHLLKIDKDTFIYNEKEISSFFNSGGVFIQEILKKLGYKTYCLNYLYDWQKKGFDFYFKQEELKPKSKLDVFLRKYPKIFKKIKQFSYFLATRAYLNYLVSKNLRAGIKPGKSAEDVTKKAIEIIDELKDKENFFIRIDYEDTHFPYYSGGISKFKTDNDTNNFFDKISLNNANKRLIAVCRNSLKRDIKVGEIIDNYDNAIYYNDAFIGNMIKKLRDENIFNNTIIFIFSDHGESLYEHEIYVDHAGIYDVCSRIPLIICGPGIPRNKKIKGLVQLEDITPTILDILNIKYNPLQFDGKGLFPLISSKNRIRESVFLEEIFNLKRKGLRTEDYKYIETPLKLESGEIVQREEPLIELYNLKNDSEEKNNLASENKELVKEMQLKMLNEIKQLKLNDEKRRIKKSFLMEDKLYKTE
ncbi:MAG: sulfatase [Candidatus Nanoarchaeia archaeon]|nr:sulfatase [Candidatus Nanoarchaeia archaeon]MDD5741448.1 sulfatase [Candidatus Nanoarchaeia archaeon]